MLKIPSAPNDHTPTLRFKNEISSTSLRNDLYFQPHDLAGLFRFSADLDHIVTLVQRRTRDLEPEGLLDHWMDLAGRGHGR